MSCLEKKDRKQKKVQKRSLKKQRNTKYQRKRYTKHCLKKQRNMKSQETKKKYVWRYQKNMKQNMAVNTSQ